MTSGVDVDIPSFRVCDWKEEVSDGSEEEDLSDETLLARHDKSLEELNAKWAAALEDRKRQKQEAREKAKTARINSKSPRSRREPRDPVSLEKEVSAPTTEELLLMAENRLPVRHFLRRQ